MTDTQAEHPPARVPARATHAGEVHARWAWTEPTVWTERMLTALEAGVKGGVWFSLIDKVSALRTLRAAWQHVYANDGAAGVDHVTVAMYQRDLERNLAQGWFEYFTHSHRETVPRIDAWIRMRLRSLLRRRSGRRGRGRGKDHQRWPNAYFAEHGLFNLTTAHALAGQSARR